MPIEETEEEDGMQPLADFPQALGYYFFYMKNKNQHEPFIKN